jgi:carbon-monoxide dehydrogenase iron sulfur subunit
MCVMVCPFGVVFHDTVNGLSLKCDLCKDSEEGPACVRACPTGALFFGKVEEFMQYVENAQAKAESG